MNGRIDTHQHLIPTSYRRILESRGLTAGGWPTPDWSPSGAIALMDRQGIATGIVSLSAPGVRLGADVDAVALARSVNDEGAELVRDRPDRFGYFASLPLPDVDASLAEIARAHDDLNVDGVVLLSNVDGTYLGDRALEPIWAELDRRDAVVFIHPTEPPIARLDALPGPILDYPFDTTRTALHMVVNGVFRRHPDLRVILSHGGGFLPYAAYRFAGAAQFTPDLTAADIMSDLRRFHVDTALSATPSALPSLLAFVDPERITYGSDFPFVPDATTFDRTLDAYPMDDDVRHGINRGNAERLFPRLGAAAS